jgi:hypothetical protein
MWGGDLRAASPVYVICGGCGEPLLGPTLGVSYWFIEWPDVEVDSAIHRCSSSTPPALACLIVLDAERAKPIVDVIRSGLL